MYKLELDNDGTWVTEEFCLRQAVNYLEYRTALGKSVARIPEGSAYTLESMREELSKLAPNEDCLGCLEKKAAVKKK